MTTAVLETPPSSATEAKPPGGQPRWARPALFALLAGTAVLYLWGLSTSGWANAFYSAAAQAGAKSWEAFFFGSTDAANSITVDKPPAALWIMDLSVRLFGLNSWSILVPQALEGVAAVAVLHATVRRWFSPTAALLSGAVLAITPVAVLMFRFNNPDSLLVLLLVIAAYFTVRAVESGHGRWLVLVGVMIGFGFLTKMLQALLVVPGFALVYLVAAPITLRRRIGHLLAAGVAMVVSAGWWIAAVELVPAAYRPYIGGSQTNSVLELTLGYNGFGRLTGNEVGSVGGGMASRQTSLSRLFTAEMGGQIAWLLPAAIILLVAALWFGRRAPRTDRLRASLMLWGSWLLVTGVVFSTAQGIIHPYYTVALAPAIAALVGTGSVVLWRNRNDPVVAGVLAATTAVTAVWSYVLLSRDSTWQPWLRIVVLIGGLAAACLLLLVNQLPRAVTRVAVVAVLVTALAGPFGYSVATATTSHTGALPTAGPSSSRMGFGRGGMGGLLDTTTPSSAMTTLLQHNGNSYTWVAAIIGSNNAAGYQLAAGLPVMAIGGFNGTDPSPTLAEFQQYVQSGRIHYFIASNGFSSSTGSNIPEQISSWVGQNFQSSTVDGTTVYDLTAKATS